VAWPYLAQVFKLERTFTQTATGLVTAQVIYGLTSLSAAEANPGRLLTLIRSYWQIENGLHYRRDVSFKEDRCRLKIGHAARTMATLNNLALALIRQQDFRFAPQARRRFAAHPLETLKLLFLDPTLPTLQ
jgi:predicted ATPase